MFRKSIALIILGAALLAACQSAPAAETSRTETVSANTQTPTSTDTPSPTATQPPRPTDTPAPTATRAPALPTDTPPPPTNAPDCVNQASFVEDVTVPDGSVIEAGMTFTKTWRVRNAGTCVWGTGYTLDYYSGERLGFTAPISLSVTLPGNTTDISVRLTAPQEEGAYQANFVIKNPGGLIIAVDEDSRLWVAVSVRKGIKGVLTPTPLPTATATPQPAEGTPEGSPPPPTATPQESAGDLPAACPVAFDQSQVDAMVDAWNAYRAQHNLPPLSLNPRLNQAAQRHANDMACHQLFYHTGSDGSTPESRVADTGYQASWVTENVYGSYPPLDGQGVITWWAADQVEPLHNENLLTTKCTEAGVAYAFYNNFGYYVIVLAAP